MIPRIYVVEKKILTAWGGPGAFDLDFDEASEFIHNLQSAMENQRHLESRSRVDFFILVIPEEAKE